jgi:hypothetical protein
MISTLQAILRSTSRLRLILLNISPCELWKEVKYGKEFHKASKCPGWAPTRGTSTPEDDILPYCPASQYLTNPRSRRCLSTYCIHLRCTLIPTSTILSFYFFIFSKRCRHKYTAWKNTQRNSWEGLIMCPTPSMSPKSWIRFVALLLKRVTSWYFSLQRALVSIWAIVHSVGHFCNTCSAIYKLRTSCLDATGHSCTM